MPDSISGIERVVIEITQRCNHACLHCYNFWRGKSKSESGHSDISRSKILRIIRKIKQDAPLNQVAFSGGEPTLRKDLAHIICDLADEGLRSVVITNGSLITGHRLRSFPENSIFEVTLFSTDAGLHNKISGTRSFQRVTENLAKIRKYKCRFVLAFVITALNAHDTKRTIELGIALGADAVMLNRINISRRIKKMAERIVPNAATLRKSLDAAEEAASQYGITVAVSVPVPPCVVDVSSYKHLHFGWCPRGGKDAYYTIGADGLLRPCNHSSVILGDLDTHGFAELTQGMNSRKFWAPVPKECIDCTQPLKNICRGGCPAASDEYYGTRRLKDPFIDICSSN